MPCQHLPIELIINILCRLQAKSLVRFKSVSKPWKSLLEDPYFIKSHKEKQPKQLIMRDHVIGRFLSVDLDSLDKMRIVDLPKFQGSYQRINLIGSSNGLVTLCCTYHNPKPKVIDYIIWNMATREHLIVPLELPHPIDIYASVASEGFGYDGVGDDYKVVTAFLSPRDGGHELITMVYSLKKHEWVSSTINSPGFSLYTQSAGSVVNGALHWLAGEFEHSWSPIIAFDLNTEEYHKVPQPIMSGGFTLFVELPVFEDSLCLVLVDDDTRNYIDIWMMKDYMVRESWTKVYSLRLNCLARPIAISKRGDDTTFLLFERTYNFKNKFYRCDITSKEQVHILQLFETFSSELITAMVYEESLALIVGTEGTRDRPTVKQIEI